VINLRLFVSSQFCDCLSLSLVLVVLMLHIYFSYTHMLAQMPHNLYLFPLSKVDNDAVDEYDVYLSI